MARCTSLGKVLLLAGLAFIPEGDAFAAEASTHFSIFVPPNNSNNGRHSALTITAHTDGTTVTVVDTDDDGDSDDSTTATLSRGQSIVIQIRDGAVNDDAGGVWDGDQFIIDSDKPVTAMLSTRSEWQHDWVPAEGKTMRGTEFFVWSPRPSWDINIVSYEDDTRVEIYEISTAATTESGLTSVSVPGRLLVRQQVNEGEDLLTTYGRAGTNLTRSGHSYHIVTSRPATVMFGAFFGRERDGGGYVPSENGTTVGTHFYFPVPAGRWQPHEREIRIVAGEAAAEVTLRGFDVSNGWVDIATENVDAYGHLDYTGRSHNLVRQYEFFEVISTQDVNVLEANWMETGNSGTSDLISYVSALDSVGASDVGREFVAYIGPPGIQNRVLGDRFSHLYIAANRAATYVEVTDVDTGGQLFSQTATIAEADDILDVLITQAEYNSMNRPDEGIRPYLRVRAVEPVSVGMANWNDNWLAFASGVLPAELTLDIDHPETMRCGIPADFTLRVTNSGDAILEDVVVEAEGIGGLIVTGTLQSIPSLAPGTTSTQVVSGTVPCTDVTSGHIVGVAGVTGAVGPRGENLAARNAGMAKVTAPGIIGIPSIRAVEDECAIEIGWVTEEDNGDAEFVILRRLFGEDVSYSEVGRVASVAPAQSGFIYGYRDIDVASGVTYQYEVRAVDAASGDDLTFAGPIVTTPGLPFVDEPFATGDLRSDYEGRGVILDDPVDDMTNDNGTIDGYDVDAIAVAYDRYNDSLFLAVSATGIFGDGDGDGDPDTNTVGDGQGISDRARFSVDETFAFVLDLDGDGQAESIVGIPFGSDIDFLQAAPANPSLIDSSPPLAFTTLDEAQAGSLFVEILNEPSADRPDLELVVRNISSLAEVDETSMGVSFYMSASGVTSEVERAPAAALTAISGDQFLSAGCGVPAAQVNLGVFAVFGNIFTGTPRFDFVPLGWNTTDTDTVLAEAPVPVPGQVITSPTVFVPEQYVDVTATMAPEALSLSTQTMRIQDSGSISGSDYLHVTQMDWDFSAAEGDERYENFDAQTFRLFVLDCSATVIIEQFGTSGILRDDRFVRMADGSIENLGEINPALILAHSGLGTFETAGAMQRVHFGEPEDWVTDFGQQTAPEFTRYSFLDDVSYLGNTVTPDSTEVYPLSTTGVQVEAGVWFINHYMWSFANQGSSRIETRFIPGPDCGGSL